MVYKSIYTIRVCFLTYLLLFVFGCVPSNVKVQIEDKQFFSTQKTELVAGLKKIEDKRSLEQREKDEVYEKTSDILVSEHLYKSLKLSGIFENVLFENFDNDKVDVILTPYLNDFFYETQANAKTAGALGISLIPFVGLAYNLAGGPSGDHYSHVNFEMTMATTNGKELARSSAKKELSLSSNLHNQKTDGVGMLEGRVLGQATYDLLLSLATNIDYNNLPASKFAKSKKCGSDNDCKGDRICVEGKCVNPDTPKKLDITKQETPVPIHP